MISECFVSQLIVQSVVGLPLQITAESGYFAVNASYYNPFPGEDPWHVTEDIDFLPSEGVGPTTLQAVSPSGSVANEGSIFVSLSGNTWQVAAEGGGFEMSCETEGCFEDWTVLDLDVLAEVTAPFTLTATAPVPDFTDSFYIEVRRPGEPSFDVLWGSAGSSFSPLMLDVLPGDTVRVVIENMYPRDWSSELLIAPSPAVSALAPIALAGIMRRNRRTAAA